MPQSVYELRFQIDHVIARQHQGQTILENLALSCLRCNAHKGPNIAGVDPATGQLTRLFHPRQDQWSAHFEWDGARLIGKTAEGRTTIVVLGINHPAYIEVREALIKEGVFPQRSI